MGVPRFFTELLKKYRNTHFSDPNFIFQHLFMDYNAFIYPSLDAFFKQTSYEAFGKLSVSKREQAVANFVVERTIAFVNEIKPEKLLYIAFDGPAPRSKMKLQRDRRYKSIKLEEYFAELKKIYNIEEKKPSSLWNSASLSPGTSAMEKIAKGLKTAAKKNKFMGGKIMVIIDDTNLPGEGEHKILNFIRYLKNLKDRVCVYSPDADVLILSLQYAGDIYNLRERDPKKKEDVQMYPNPDVKHIIFSVTKYREALKEEFKGEYDEVRLSRDLIFITFFIGNDFVKSIYYLKSNKGGFWKILGIYKRLLHKYQHTEKPFLVEIKDSKDGPLPLLNQNFLVDILQELANIEDRSMKEYYARILSEMGKTPEDLDDTYEGKKAAFEHAKYFEHVNPFSEPELFKIIDYNEPRNIWNQQYYSYFFNITPDNPREFRNYKRLICKTYLESLSFCLRYYLTGLPSWDWYYPFRVAPMPSDILYFMNDMPKGLNFQFDQGKPYYPIEQLTMILPPQGISLLPRPIRSLVTSATSPLAPYYPIDFELEKVFGEKYIYSHALLPPFVDEIVRPAIQETFSKFTKTEKERNKLSDTYDLYEPENMSLKELMLDVPRTITVNTV